MFELDPSIVVLAAVAFVAATVNGGIGYGFSSITVPAGLLFHTNRVLNPGLVLVELFLNALSLVANRRALPRVWRRVVPMLAGALPGVVLGSLALAAVHAGGLKLATYALLLPLVLLQLGGFRRPFRDSPAAGGAVGFGIGALYAATTISGPPLALVFNNQGLAKEEFRAALGLFRLAQAAITCVVYLALGLFSRESIAVAGTLVPSIALGIPLGFVLFRAVEAETFRRVCMAADAVLVSYGLSRSVVELGLTPAPVAYAGIGVVLVIEAALIVRYAWQRSLVPLRTTVREELR